jgi:hypothetical protein
MDVEEEFIQEIKLAQKRVGTDEIERQFQEKIANLNEVNILDLKN